MRPFSRTVKVVMRPLASAQHDRAIHFSLHCVHSFFSKWFDAVIYAKLGHGNAYQINAYQIDEYLVLFTCMGHSWFLLLS